MAHFPMRATHSSSPLTESHCAAARRALLDWGVVHGRRSARVAVSSSSDGSPPLVRRGMIERILAAVAEVVAAGVVAGTVPLERRPSLCPLLRHRRRSIRAPMPIFRALIRVKRIYNFDCSMLLICHCYMFSLPNYIIFRLFVGLTY